MPTEIISMLVNQLPVTLLMGWLWWLERKERRAAQRALDDCLKSKDDLHADQ
jgi:hypothetical protein